MGLLFLYYFVIFPMTAKAAYTLGKGENQNFAINIVKPFSAQRANHINCIL